MTQGESKNVKNNGGTDCFCINPFFEVYPDSLKSRDKRGDQRISRGFMVSGVARARSHGIDW
jgi:hypothetical protein